MIWDLKGFFFGSLTKEEIEILNQSISVKEKSELVLSLFQETYDRVAYQKYFGQNQQSSKSDYDQRLRTIDYWVEAGFNKIDIGILLGFKSEFEYDVLSLISHANRFLSAGVEVYISTPRIKGGLISETTYISILNKLRDELPNVKLIVTTRESTNFINSNIQLFDVISPGSSDVCPYSHSKFISNNPKTSQFVISEMRLSPSSILNLINLPSFKFYQ